MKDFPANHLNENGIATLLRGFAQQIQQLAKPRLFVVKQIGEGIGLVILTKQEHQSLSEKQTDSKADAIKLVLGSSVEDTTKLKAIAELLSQ